MKTNRTKKWFTLHCGLFRSFDVKAQNEKQALNRFDAINRQLLRGWSRKDVTHITLAERQDRGEKMKRYWTDRKGHFTCRQPSYRKLAVFANGRQISDGWVYAGMFYSAKHAKRDYKNETQQNRN